MNTIPWQANCFRGMAIAKRSIKYCDIISERSEKSRCVTFFAIKEKNPRICQELLDPAWKAQCLKDVA